MFAQFFTSGQQDFKLMWLFPIICAIFRWIFIKTYSPYPNFRGRSKALWHCFRYGFWWGMDFNAYVFLFSWVLVTLPGLFLPGYYAVADTVRIIPALIYALILYLAFAGKMMFYSHFNDTYNQILLLGRKAEKHNLIDVFFHEDHGALVLLGIIPYEILCYLGLKFFLGLPSLSYPIFSAKPLTYAFNFCVAIGPIVLFYWLRYGGTFMHDDKPEWDTIPSVTKKDVFLAKATVDDLPALENVLTHPLNAAYTHTDEEDLAAIAKVWPKEAGTLSDYDNLVYGYKHKAQGAKIAKPSHIFLLVVESYLQQLFDPQFACLNLVSGGRKLMDDPNTFHLPTALSAGIISRPSLVGIMEGIFDGRLELNEKEPFWNGTLPTSLPLQLKKLGYTSTYWYGGNVTNGNFNRFAPAVGFDKVMTATDFCPPDSPKTWVGIYDNIFLEHAANLISEQSSGGPEFHMLYTTSFHPPYKINLKKYGYDTEKVMPQAPNDIKGSTALQKTLGTFWFADQAVGKFIDDMRTKYPDCLFIVTGDHAVGLSKLENTSLAPRKFDLRERHSPVLMFNHKDLKQDFFAGNTIGGHMNIMPTLMELIAPRDYEYYSLFPSLTEPLDHLVTPYHWLSKDIFGSYRDGSYQQMDAKNENHELKEMPDPIPYKDEKEGWLDITRYLLRHPELLTPKDKL